MIRVICIDASDKPNCTIKASTCLVEGDNYMVKLSGNFLAKDNNYYPGYVLYDIADEKYAFSVERFIPTSDIDELQLVNEKDEVNA